MSLASKVFGMWAIGKTLSSTTPLFMRLLLGMAAITAIAIVSAILMALLIAGLFWFTYLQLIAYGLEPDNVLLALCGLALAVIAFATQLIRSYWIKVQKISTRIAYMQAPVTGRISNIADAFLDGFMAPVSPKRG